ASPNQLRDLSALLTASGVNAVYNEDASDEGKKQTTPPPPSAHDPAQDTAQDGANDANPDADPTQGPDDVSEAPAPEEAKDTADGQAVSDETPTDAPTTQDATAPDEAAATDKPNDTPDEAAPSDADPEVKGTKDNSTPSDQNDLDTDEIEEFDLPEEGIEDNPYAERFKKAIDAEDDKAAEELAKAFVKDAEKDRFIVDKEIPPGHPNVEPPKKPIVYGLLFAKAFGTKLALKLASKGKKGSVTGKPDKTNRNMNSETLRGHARERESVDILVEAGYDVELGPAPKESDGIPLHKNPDYRINEKIYDNIAPKSSSVPKSVARRIRRKLSDRQAKRFVVNLTDYKGSLGELIVYLAKQKYRDLEDLIFIIAK
ncbi:MAG: hypothetical protein OIF54_05980, partial [Cohaesibacter sp.]|nr:hypothetical protein [Cohaesibacter sp.]